MSLASRTAFGIDPWDGTVKIAQLARRGRSVRLVGTWRTSYGRGDGDAFAAALDALASTVRHAPRFGSARVVVAAPTRGMVSGTYVVPAMDAPRLEELVRYEVLSQLDALPEDVVVRHHVRKGVVEQEVHACALRRRAVDEVLAELDARRIPYDELETPGFALASLAEHEIPTGRDRVLLAVGRVATELVLHAEHGLWMRHLPLGLSHERDNHRLARRLAAEIAGAAELLLPSDRPFRPAELLLTEEGALGAALTSALEQATGLDVKRFGALQRIRTPARPRGDARPEESLAMGKAIGLALCGLGLARIRAPVVAGNERRDVLRLVPRVAPLVLLASAGLVAVPELTAMHARRLDAVLPARLEQRLHDGAAERERVLAEQHALGREYERLDALAARRRAAAMPRRALAQAARLAAAPGARGLTVDQVLLSPRNGVMRVTLHAPAPAPDGLAERIDAALRAEFDELAVHGPEAAGGDRVRYLVEVPLP